MKSRTRPLGLLCALALAVGANGCTTCGSNPEGEWAAGESMGQAAQEEAIEDAERDSSY